MGFFRRITGIMLAIITFFSVMSFTACNKEQEPEPLELQVFDMPSTVKVLKAEDYSDYYTENPVISFESAKNEYENAQIIFNPSRDVKSFTVAFSDLVCGDEIFSKNNIEIYAQKYVNVVSSTPSKVNHPLGEYPDPLIPIENYIEANENVATANKNQGLWFTAYVPKETKAGIYTGTCTLTTDEVVTKIPVSLKVRDFELTDETHLKTIFTTTQEWLNGELDNTDEMYLRYKEQLREYKISQFQLPYESEVDSFIKYAKEYTLDPKMSAYNMYIKYTTIKKADFPLRPDGLPYEIVDSNINYQLTMFDEEVFETYIRAMIENSEEGCNLFDKVVGYIGSLDEAHARGMEENCKWFSTRMIDCLIVIANSYSDTELSAHGLTKRDIIGLDLCFTIPYSSETVGMRGYCPLLSQFATYEQRAKYAEARELTYAGYNGQAEGLNNQFWYFCMHPYEPSPTAHIDAYLIGTRIMGWMSYDFDMEGILTWGTACYLTSHNAGAHQDYYNARNPYENLQTGGGVNGDGFLVYPGKKYGIYGFVPSVRLQAIRDALEDYEYLYALEKEIKKCETSYGIDGFDLEAELRKINATLYDGTRFNTDYSKIFDARTQIADMLELVTGATHSVIKVNEVNAPEKEVDVEVYAANGTQLFFNNEQVEGVPSDEGTKFRCTVSLTDKVNVFRATLKFGSYEYKIEKILFGKVESLAHFENGIDGWTTLDDGEYKPVTLSGKDGKLVVNIERNVSDNAFYVPGFKVDAETLFGEVELANVDNMQMTIINSSDREVDISLILETRTANGQIKQNLIKNVPLSVGKNIVSIDQFYAIELTGGFSNIEGFAIKVLGTESGEVNLALDNIYCEYKGDK